MGFLSGIIGKDSFLGKVIDSPYFKMAMTALGPFTAGISTAVGTAVSAVKGLASGNISEMFGSVASSFLGGAGGGLAASALGIAGEFLNKAKDTGDVKNMAGSWMKAITGGGSNEQSVSSTGSAAEAANGSSESSEADSKKQVEEFLMSQVMNNVKQMLAKKYEELKEARQVG